MLSHFEYCNLTILWHKFGKRTFHFVNSLSLAATSFVELISAKLQWNKHFAYLAYFVDYSGRYRLWPHFDYNGCNLRSFFHIPPLTSFSLVCHLFCRILTKVPPTHDWFSSTSIIIITISNCDWLHL